MAAATTLLVAACTPAPPARDPGPPPPGTPVEPPHLDCARWRYDGVQPGPLPPEWDPDDYRFTSARDAASADSPHRLCGQLGAAVDLAWGLHRGRSDVVVAVLDSGIRWGDPGAMADLADQTHLNRGELPAPQPATRASADDWDPNGDGRLSVSDYDGDPRVADRNGNGLLDPQDLIRTFSDGTDADGNGYVDDIAGWDFLHDDNDPDDDVDYGHGTGEARDSTAAHDGSGAAGTCPGCMHLPVRVADSFIADGGRFAAGVLFAVDSGADVVQEALGAISNPPQAQQAVTAAYRRGVPVVASMADEQSQHPNLPAAMRHTIPVNSLTEGGSWLGDLRELVTPRRDALALNGCTNTGGITWVAVPSDGCSSEAVGNSSGMVALIQSAAREAGVAPHPDLVGLGVVGPGANVLSAEEVAQLLRAGADDVDFSTPNAVDPANEDRDDIDQRRFPTRKGWDATTGHGRINAYEPVKAVLDGRIPPEADIEAPGWFATLPTSGALAVTGRVAAVRSGSYSYRVEWATGLHAPAHPGGDDWRVVAEEHGLTSPRTGTLATVDLASVAAALPDDGRGVPMGPDGRPDPDRFTVRLRVVVTDADGRVAVQHRHVQVHHDPDRLPAGDVPAVGSSSPVFADLDGDGADELLVATDDGHVHALRPDGAELDGWPVRTGPSPFWHPGSATARAEGIDDPGAAVSIGAPSVADLDGDGPGGTSVVVTDLEGGVHVFAADGTRTATMSIDRRFSRGADTDERHRVKPGIIGAAALGDLDADGDLEAVVAALDRHVYAWHHDGSPVDGFPVLLVDPDEVAEVDPTSHRVRFAHPEKVGQGGELVATPALGDLDGDGRPEIVVGAQEQYSEDPDVFPGLGIPDLSGNARIYAVSPDGTRADGADRSAAHPHDHAYLDGWPASLTMVMSGVLPSIGNGVNTQAAIADVDGDGGPEVVASSVSGPVTVLDPDGVPAYGRPLGLRLALPWLFAVPAGSALSRDTGAVVAAFGGPSVGALTPEGGLDVVSPTSGSGRALDTLLPNDQEGDPQLTAWNGRTGGIRNGFPRPTADLAFFVTPAIADVDGDGRSEGVAGNGIQTLDAVAADGSVPAGWPKLTGGWVVGTPGFGDWDGDGRAELAVTRRDGHLLVWRTPTAVDAVGDWARFGGGPLNDGRPTPR